MRYVNEKFETIAESEIDLEKGYLSNVKAIREDAEPIDNVKKFAWDDDDFEEAQMYVIYDENELIDSKIEQLKQSLKDTDYVILKIVEGACSLEECAETIRKRAAWRKEINELENSISG